MKPPRLISLLAFSVLVAVFSSTVVVATEGTDSCPPLEKGASNVLIILDNTANWNAAFTNERSAIVDTFLNMDPDSFNVGLMMFGESPNLGYVRAAVRPMSDTAYIGGTTYTYSQLYAAMIASLDVNGDKGNARTLARTFSEAYSYLHGATSVDTSSNTGVSKNIRRDYANNLVGTLATQRVHAQPGNALDSAADSSYTAPPQPGACAKTYVIYIGNNVSGGNVTADNISRNTAAKTDLDAAAAAVGVSGASTLITAGFTYTAHQGNYADEWARFMHLQDNVTFYAVDVNPTAHPDYDGTSGHTNGMGSSELLRSLSEGVGGGKYFRVTSTGSEVVDAVSEILSEIQTWELIDADGDGVDDATDNCLSLPNTDQLNTDGADDGGDACDGDDDDDTSEDVSDNCPLISNTDQLNTDGADDGGDACDGDDDDDTSEDVSDNCPLISNTDQLNTDGADDGGDACDGDDDDDTSEDVSDNCPLISNTDQLNTDGADDGGDVCDGDDDNDASEDVSDNCPLISNTDQLNTDGADDGGDVCDGDDDNDASEDISDNCPFKSNPDQADSDGDGIGNVCDLPAGCG